MEACLGASRARRKPSWWLKVKSQGDVIYDERIEYMADAL